MEYNDDIRSCSLSHCVSCGSTKIWSEFISQINSIGVSIVFVFFVLVFTTIFFEVKTMDYMFIGLFAGLMIWTLKNGFIQKRTHLCLNCFAKGFSPLTTVKVQEKRRENTEKFESTSPEKIKELLSISYNSKSKFDTMILVIGLAIIIIGIIFSSVIQGWVEKTISG